MKATMWRSTCNLSCFVGESWKDTDADLNEKRVNKSATREEDETWEKGEMRFK